MLMLMQIQIPDAKVARKTQKKPFLFFYFLSLFVRFVRFVRFGIFGIFLA